MTGAAARAERGVPTLLMTDRNPTSLAFYCTKTNQRGIQPPTVHDQPEDRWYQSLSAWINLSDQAKHHQGNSSLLEALIHRLIP